MSDLQLNYYKSCNDLVALILKYGSEIKDLNPFFEIFFKNYNKFFNILGGSVYLIDKPGQCVRMSYSTEIPEKVLSEFNKISPNKRIYHQLFEQREIYFIENYSLSLKDKGKDKDSCDIFFIPLLSKGEAVGALSLCLNNKDQNNLNNVSFFNMLGYLIGTIIEKINAEKKCAKASNDLSLYENSISEETKVDPLTRIKNKNYLNEILVFELNREKRYKNGLSIIIFDIDKLNKINDKFTVKDADQAIIELSKIVLKSVRLTDYFFRLNGGTFILLLTNTTTEYAIKLAERLRQNINTNNFKVIKRVTCSFGVTEIHDNDTAASILKRAKKILSTAKVSGKNNVVFAS